MPARGRKVKTFAGSGATPNPSLQDAVKRARSAAAGQYGTMAAPSAASMRKFIQAQQCPWCGRGPWKVLATHTRSAHGVSAAELRDMAGLVKQASICSDEHQANTRERNRRVRGDRMPPEAVAALTARREHGRDRKTLGPAGREAQRTRALALTTEQRQQAAMTLAKTLAAKNRPKYDEILHLFDEGLRLKDIASRAQVGVTMVKSIVRAERGSAGFVRRRTDSPEWRQAALVGLRKGAETASQRRQAERETVRAEFERAGGTWQALQETAATYGITVSSMRAKLVKAGATVPDGRHRIDGHVMTRSAAE